MSLKDGIPKQWGQYYLKKLIDGDPDPLLENWNMFEQGSLSNWTDPASVQVAERRLRALNQSCSAQEYATEFRVIASELELGENALMSESRWGLQRDVKTELIKFSMGRNISTLDQLISTACLIDIPCLRPVESLRVLPKYLHEAERLRHLQWQLRDPGDPGEVQEGWKMCQVWRKQPQVWRPLLWVETAIWGEDSTWTGKMGDLISLETPVESGKA
jgi:hypothetical protein